MTKDIEEQIKELKEQGNTLAQISKIVGKSIYFVYSRLNDKYKPGRLEDKYIEKHIIPYLTKEGFTDIELGKSREDFRGDIIAKKEGFIHIFEVKKDSQRSLLCFAVGEIILSRIENNKIKGKKKYHIILPHSSWRDPWTKKESKFLEKNYDIDIIFI